MTAVPIATAVLVLLFVVFFEARDRLHLPLAQLQTLAFLLLVFSGQGLVYLLRTEGYLWASRPGRWLMIASAADIAVVFLLAQCGVLMAPLPAAVIVALLGIVAVFLLALDVLKAQVLRRWSSPHTWDAESAAASRP
jgi:H+-transporting ATPase